VLTDGHDDGSVLSLEDTIAAAQVSNTVIYSILYTDDKGAPVSHLEGTPKMTGKDVLEKLSTATGGHMFEVTFREPLEKIFGSIEEEMRMQYVLYYSPAKSSAGPGFRKIELKGRDKTWKIQTRAGYFYTAADGD
jgi:Ca-activated chloride channel family protein